MKCLLCNNYTTRPKFCSYKCVKRSWYIRHNPNVKSYFTNNPLFWKTETGIGFKWEKYMAKKLGAKHLEFNWEGADLELNGKLIDVKSCELYKRKYQDGKIITKERKGVWVFNRGKIKPMDYFCCVCLKDDKPVKIFILLQ